MFEKFSLDGLDTLARLIETSPASTWSTALLVASTFGACALSLRRGGNLRAYKALCLGAAVQCLILVFGMHVRWIVLSGLSWLVGEWLYTRLATLSKPQGHRRNWSFSLARITGVMAVGLVAYADARVRWSDVPARLQDCGLECEPLAWGLGLLTITWVLQSGLLKDRAHRGQTAHALFLEFSLHRLPLALFAWTAFSKLGFTMHTELAEILVSLGMLVFLVYQWIGMTRNYLVDIFSCVATAHSGLFWGIIGLTASGLASDPVFAYFWASQILIGGFAGFLVWLEREQVELRERTMRGALRWSSATAIPLTVFFAGLSGQPWSASGALFGETLDTLSRYGTSVGIFFFLGIVLQSTKLSHLVLSMALPQVPGPRMDHGQAFRFRPEKTTLMWLWILAMLAVATGLFPFYRAWVQAAH